MTDRSSIARAGWQGSGIFCHYVCLAAWTRHIYLKPGGTIVISLCGMTVPTPCSRFEAPQSLRLVDSHLGRDWQERAETARPVHILWSRHQNGV